MQFLVVDIRTVMLLLWMGNLVVVLLFASYNQGQKQKLPRSLFSLARLAQTAGWMLMWLRGAVPDVLSILMGNAMLFSGWALEALAILSLRQRRQRFEAAYALAMLATLLTHIYLYQLQSSNLKIVVASFIPLGLFLPPALALSFEKRASALQRAVGILYLTFCTATSLRGLAALTAGSPYALLTPDPAQTFTYIALFWMMLFGSIGYLLLSKEQADRELLLAATTDPLTGILNRRAFYKDAGMAISHAIRSLEPVAVLALDIDYLKQINDGHGHAAGDLVLKDFAAIALQTIRACDLFARTGGDEFVLLLPNTAPAAALHVAQRIQGLAESRRLPEKPALRYTISVGLCSRVPQSFEDLAAMARVSDEALFEAKAAGRNRVILVEDQPA